MLLAMGIYVMTMDESIAPPTPPEPSVPAGH